MNRTIKSALIVVAIILGLCGVATSQTQKGEVDDPFAGVVYGNDPNPKEIVRLRGRVSQGDVSALELLADHYSMGVGVKKNNKEAARLRGLAAAKGRVDAQTKLAWMYRIGEGVAQNYREAMRLYRLAAAQGDQHAMIELGWLYSEGKAVPRDFVRSHMWYNLGSVSEISSGSTNRSDIEAKMTPAQIAEAQAMARKCQASNFKQCD